jgi:acetyl-CoA carboxylase beta subunit
MPEDMPARTSTTSPPPRTASEPSGSKQETPQNYWDYCPNCGARLHNRGCKYRCPRCHYFMSCSDFD